MSTTLRDALAAAAGEEAMVPPEAAIEHRTARLRRNRALARGGAAVLSLVVLTTGALALATHESDSAGQQVKAADTPDTTVEPTTTTEVPASSTTVAPPPTSAPKPKATASAPRPASAGTSRTLGPRSPGSAVFGFQSGRTSWSGTTNGVDLAVSIDKATPKAGEPVVFTLTAGSATHPCCGFVLGRGDGGTFAKDNGYGCPGGGPPGPGTRTVQTTQVYNKAGRWEFVYSGVTGNCETSGPTGHLYGWVEVAPGTATSQGPSQPTIQVARYGPTQYDNDPSYVAVWGKARDEDGFVFKLVVDYGDGATEQFPGDQMGCKQTANGWPGSSMGWTPTNPPPTHKYATQGTYKITITAYSSGCDGRDVQSVSGSFEHVY